MAEPATKTVWQSQECKFEVPADYCRIDFGYKNRDTIVFAWREDYFYLCDDRRSRYPDGIKAVDVPLAVLAEHWPAFIEFLQAKVAEAKEVSDGHSHGVA
jgi:hypothetical protein